MEPLAASIIPTLSKSKISHHLSYPAGAEMISSALIDTAQFPQLKLHFHFWSDHFLRNGDYEFLRVEYLNDAVPVQNYPVWVLHNRPPQYRWEVVVQPVPRIYRHQIKQYIQNEALSQIKTWLDARRNLVSRGSDVLCFFFEEKEQQFRALTATHVEPPRI